MKNYKRFLSWVMTLVMIFSCYSGTDVFASTTDITAYKSTEVCSSDHSDWIPLTTATIGSYMTLYNNHYYLNEGSYYLAETLNMGVTIYIWPSATVNLCLNGYDITMTNSNRTILNPKNSATLNLYDCGTQVRYYDESGWVTAPTADGSWETATETEIADTLAAAHNPIKIIGGAIYGASSFDKGGAGVFIQNYATFNMYGGNILGCSCSTTSHWGGGVYNYCGTFNMYNGVIAYNSSSTYAGGLFIRTGSTVNMYGGEIAYNYAPTSGAGVYSGGVFTMSGDASIHDNYGSYEGSGFYNAGGGTLIMQDNSSIYGNISGDGGGAGVDMPSYNSILSMSDNASITGNKSTGVAVGVEFNSGEMTISDNAEVSGNYVIDEFTIKDSTTLNANNVNLKIIDTIGEKVVDSNVYLYNGETITFDDFYGTDVYVTSASGLGLVATNATDDDGNLSSDVTSYYAVRVDETTVHLTEAQTLDGHTATKTYASGDIDLSNLGIFDVLTDDTVYTITGGTGTGTIDDEDLTVSSIGTFIIEAYTPHSPTNPPTWQTSTLTVKAKSVNITGISTIGSEVDKKVELDNTKGTLSGVVNDDDVSIDFSVAYGIITDDDYVEGEEDTYDVTIHDISITGNDAGNYILDSVNNNEGTTVEINIATPNISWPTATDIIYGNVREDANLIGGTAVIKYGDVYYDITDSGKFVWVETGTVDDAGTHTYAVKFQFNDDIKSAAEGGYIEAEYDKYILAVESLTHNVSQVVQAAEVTFTITDSTLAYGDTLQIIVKDENNNTLSTSDYEYLYYNRTTDTGWFSETPTDVGSYLVGASLTENYRHAGTHESTAKQIGAFEIYETSASTTYTVTFTGYDSYTVTGALPETIHILPTLDESLYSAWTTTWADVATVYDFGSRFPQPDHDVIFTPVDADNSTVKLSGTITGTDLESNENANLQGVVVTLMQGAEQIAATTTDSNGKYEFNVPIGRYNLVVTRDQVIRNEETLYVELDSDTQLPTISIPDIRQNTIFNVSSGMTAITVDGMEYLIANDTEVRSIKVELSPSSDTADILAEAAKSALTTDNAKLYIDLSINERTEDSTGYEKISSLNSGEMLTFYIPLAGIYQGYDNYTVYFDDGDSVVALTSSNATVSESGDLLTLTVQKSGVYGLAFWNNSTNTTEGTDITDAIYSTTPIDASSMFDSITSDGTRTYIITGGTGEGTIDEYGKVTVTKVGTFEITVKVAETINNESYIGTATLTINPKPVTISAITCINQEVDNSSNVVTLNTGALLTGAEEGDSVRIDFTNAIGTIDNAEYYNDTTLTTTGEKIFDVTVTGLALTGSDAYNYIISETSDYSSQVTVNMSIVYIAWPAAHDIVYGETQSITDLYGGKVVVYDGETGSYTDITDNGYFQWVTLEGDDKDDGADNGFTGTDSSILANAGTYTYDVKFVEDETSSGTYSEALDSATQMITQIIQPSPVTFTIEDTTIDAIGDLSVIATESSGTITEADYELWYSDGSWSTTAPTTTGEYLLGASLTSNYRHAGTQESTAKQIGAFTIGIENPDTYTVTFTGYTGDTNYDITSALAEAIHILPTLDETLYTGWEHQDGTTYNFGERFPQPKENVTFTAIVAPAKDKTISGTITGTDLNGVEDTALSRVGVALYQGSTLVDYGETSTDGNYSFTVAAGVYNLVVTRDLGIAAEITVFVDTTNSNVIKDFELPDVIQNAVLEVATGLPSIVVNGLTVLSEAGTNDGSQNSEILLTITANTTDDDDIIKKIQDKAAEAGITQDEIKEFFNIDLSSRTGDQASFSTVTETDTLLTIYIPLTGIYQGHDDYTVYRYHNNSVDVLNTTDNGDGEFIEVSGTNLIIHTNKFSLYGIALLTKLMMTLPIYRKLQIRLTLRIHLILVVVLAPLTILLLSLLRIMALLVFHHLVPLKTVKLPSHHHQMMATK
ncbi:MAG: hypothetical protein R3Y09_04070 [Clostridia bacterium]